ERATSSKHEIQELIETVVVPETWFFRDAKAFEVLAEFVVHEWLPASPQGSLKILSGPCSTGEEPYSVAMALLDVGMPAHRFTIDAVDISARAVAKAKAGVYGANSFRGQSLEFRERYFEETAIGYTLKRSVCRSVAFHQSNLLSAEQLIGPYD